MKIAHTIKTQDFSMNVTGIATNDKESGDETATFAAWLFGIARASFGFVTMKQLEEHNRQHEQNLKKVFEIITYGKDGTQYFSSKYDRAAVEANIRKAFYDRRTHTTKEELIPQEADLLNIANFISPIYTDSPEIYYPDQRMVENVVLADEGKLNPPQKHLDAIKYLEEFGTPETADALKAMYASHPARDWCFHYIPYKTDSDFEKMFLETIPVYDFIKEQGLEVYYNGDRALTEFKILCYKSNGGRWSYIGKYTPDFLIIKRKEGTIYKAVIVETKGKIYAHDPTFLDKRRFMEANFTKLNNKEVGYDRFAYLYLEDSMPEGDRMVITQRAITDFFKEDKIDA
jgi:hypothetical protein